MGETSRWERLVVAVAHLASSGISLMEGVTVKFADVETSGFDVGDERAYKDIGYLQTPDVFPLPVTCNPSLTSPLTCH